MILLSDGQPNVYSEDGSDSSSDGGYAATAAENRATTIKNSHKTNFELYTVGFTTEVECLENIASDSSKYHYAVGADLGSIFNNILNSILWVINNGTVADIMGGQVNLITKEEDISYSPTVLNPTGFAAQTDAALCGCLRRNHQLEHRLLCVGQRSPDL